MKRLDAFVDKTCGIVKRDVEKAKQIVEEFVEPAEDFTPDD
jgi:hypothetical protein